MTKLRKPNVPKRLHGDDQESQGFLQTLSNYSDSLIPIGAGFKWGSTVLPSDRYLFKNGQVVNQIDFPDLWTYAQNDVSYTTTATTITLPVDAGFVVKAK